MSPELRPDPIRHDDAPVKVPRHVDHEIKDLVHPIVLRRAVLWRTGLAVVALAVVGVAAWYAFLRPPTGEALLADAVEAAGGMAPWNAIDGGTFTRVHTVFDEDEQPARVITERHAFRHGEDGGIVMETTKGSDIARIGRSNDGYWATLNGEPVAPEPLARDMEMMCESDLCTPTCSMELAFYRFSMPFKLTDPGVIPTYGGSATLAGRPVSLLHIGFEDGVGGDRWTLYVDDETKLIRKIDYYENADLDAVDTPPTEIYWSDHRAEDGLVLAHRQTYYRSNGTKLEEYVIQDVDLTSPVSDAVFGRSAEGLALAAP